MKNWTKTILAASIIAITAVGAGTALARGGDCGAGTGAQGKEGKHRMSAEDRAAHMTKRADAQLASLETALALTPAQRPAWDTFSASMRERAAKFGEHARNRASADKPETALERLARMEEMSQRMQTAATETRQAVERFYATLSDAQKTVFDADFATHSHGGRGGHRKGPHHERPMGSGRS